MASSRKLFEETPKDPDEWEAAATAANLVNKSLRSCKDLRSGSRITHEEFLLFRAVCLVESPPRSFLSWRHKLATQMQQARQNLAASAVFQNYLTAVRTGVTQNMGDFGISIYQQREVLNSVKTTGNKLIDKDETSVNSSLISFLQAITAVNPGHCRWRSSRIQLIANFGTGNKKHEYKAVTDGQLQRILTREILCVAECKRDEREKHLPQVEMQEVAQVVAWIKEYPDPNIQRILVSQDGPEIYVTFPEYDNDWVKYLNGGSIAEAGLMKMVKYGPYLIGDPDDMRMFAEIALAVSLRG